MLQMRPRRWTRCLLLAAWPAFASAEERAGSAVPAAPTPAETPIWTVTGCAGVLAQVRDGATGSPVAGARVQVIPRGHESEVPTSGARAALSSKALRRLGRTSAE